MNEYEEILYNNGWMPDGVNELAQQRNQLAVQEKQVRSLFTEGMIKEMKKTIEKIKTELPELDANENRRQAQKFCYAYEALSNIYNYVIVKEIEYSESKLKKVEGFDAYDDDIKKAECSSEFCLKVNLASYFVLFNDVYRTLKRLVLETDKSNTHFNASRNLREMLETIDKHRVMINSLISLYENDIEGKFEKKAEEKGKAGTDEYYFDDKAKKINELRGKI